MGSLHPVSMSSDGHTKILMVKADSSILKKKKENVEVEQY